VLELIRWGTMEPSTHNAVDAAGVTMDRTGCWRVCSGIRNLVLFQLRLVRSCDAGAA
jgi:hypothetical protein